MRNSNNELLDPTILDRLTGILNREGFLSQLESVIQAGDFRGGVIYFDVQRFKAINDMFGVAEGDRFLCYIADRLKGVTASEGFTCRVGGDRFAFYAPYNEAEISLVTENLLEQIASFDLPVDSLCNAGICMLHEGLDANSTLDFAIIAQNAIKGSFTKHIRFYTDELRRNLIDEQEISGMMRTALSEEHFKVYYQPQCNHATGMIVGAEALSRWEHPERGVIPPAQFVPVFERNGFVSRLDLYVFEKVCGFLRDQLDNGVSVVPVSVNLARYDIFAPGFLDEMEEIRKRYDVPTEYLRVEITESSTLGGVYFINDALKTLHQFGYLVEMDDFGSGYSSLNILKDVDFDVIKLDMKFFDSSGVDHESRGGIILSSVVRMMEWLGLPIIAEGVETPEQADFLLSIGCETIQGYLYSPALEGERFTALLKEGKVERPDSSMQLIDAMDAFNFWSSDSLETLIFSNYVGGACIFEFDGNRAEVLRVNAKYLHELGMNLAEKDVVAHNLLDMLDDQNRKIYLDTLQKAIEVDEEQECETWRTISSNCCGEDRICIRTNMRVVGRSKNRYIVYGMVRNVTSERQLYADMCDTERRFKAASEQANIYFWEYSVATQEMRPCFRCMRDLGLPAVLKNYPDSAIDMGVFPPEVADMYRDWHRQIAEGAESLEAIIPLTVGRVPFHVRYTTEFDEAGRPVKAYGSATLVVD